jgi:beta-glucosidase
MQFPKEFLWGVATSAAQIEGAADEDGRGESIWDRFAATPGKIEDGSDTRIACDHYHRWRADIELLRSLGVNSYRFSIAWPRIMPAGRGTVNEKGLAFYDRLVDGLLHAGIRPSVTLYHWDLPQALQDEGGWGQRRTAEAFVDYASAVAKQLGNRVSHWSTHNEPWCIAALGHELGSHAPGHHDPGEALRVAHHVLLSHGWAVGAIRANAPGAEVGIVLNLTPVTPASASEADKDAAREYDGWFNRWYLDPLHRGQYPSDAISDRIRRGHLANSDMAFVQAGDMEAIASPTDFLGVNYYSRAVIKRGADGGLQSVQVAPKHELTDMGWEVYPRGLYELLLRLHAEYRPPRMYITENGAAYGEVADAAGRIRDDRRVAYLREHLAMCHRAVADGIPLRGYFVWSLLDNFEWAQGYERRFGLFGVDYATQQRIPKDSAHWYRDFIAAQSGAGSPADALKHRGSRDAPRSPLG